MFEFEVRSVDGQKGMRMRELLKGMAQNMAQAHATWRSGALRLQKCAAVPAKNQSLGADENLMIPGQGFNQKMSQSHKYTVQGLNR